MRQENSPVATKKRTKTTTTKTARPKRASSGAKKKASPKKRVATRTTAKSTTGKTGRKKPASSQSSKARTSDKKETGNKASSKQRTRTQKTVATVSGEIVTIDRRGTLCPEDSGQDKAAGQSDKPKLERRKKVQRRRQIDPTTCERDYSMEEVEFMGAIDDYKRKSGRSFPTCSEVLEVIRSLGYQKQPSQWPAAISSGEEISAPVQSPDAGELVGAGCDDEAVEWEI
jgi:hypothetical protein